MSPAWEGRERGRKGEEGEREREGESEEGRNGGRRV